MSFNWLSSPTSVDDLFVFVLEHVREGLRGILHFMCVGAMWTLWKTRNDVVFNNKVLASPMVVIHKTGNP